jgi:dTMP kinase
MSGEFITFEGIECSGKTTCLEEVAKYLTKQNSPHVKTQEPNENYGRKFIKNEFLLQNINDPIVELFAYCLDRRLDVKNNIIPAMAKGYVVLCDRYVDSTRAYQGYLQNLPLSYVDVVQGVFPMPHLTLLFDLPAEMAITRMLGRTKKEKFDAIEELKILRDAFLDIAKKSKRRIKIIDATQSKEIVAQQAIKTINEVLQL